MGGPPNKSEIDPGKDAAIALALMALATPVYFDLLPDGQKLRFKVNALITHDRWLNRDYRR